MVSKKFGKKFGKTGWLNRLAKLVGLENRTTRAKLKQVHAILW
jgi:hypothetical protein